MKATVSAILDGAIFRTAGQRWLELHFDDGAFGFQYLRVPEKLLDLGAVNVGDQLDVNFLPESMMAQVNEALADGIIGLATSTKHEWNKELGQCTCGYKPDPLGFLHWEKQWSLHLVENRPPTSQCPYCGEHFIELGEGKMSHWCAEESKAREGRTQ